jgi:hypothetical protein
MKFSSLVLLASIGAVSAFTPSLPSSKVGKWVDRSEVAYAFFLKGLF